MNPLLTIPLAAGILFILELLIFGYTWRKTTKKYRDYPSAAPRKYPLVVDAKLDQNINN